MYSEYADKLTDCKDSSWFLHDGTVSCDPGSVFTLQTPSTIVDPELLPFDRQISATKEHAPAAILYADVSDPQFLIFHSLLMAEADKGKLNYILRYKPSNPETASSVPLRSKGLSGYGVELALKRTDYIVIDDRDKADGSEQIAHEAASVEQETVMDSLFSVPETRDITPLKSYELEDIGLQTSGFVLQSRNGDEAIETLLKIVEDFPKHAASIASANVENIAEIRSEIYDNLQLVAPRSRLTHGDNAIFANGARVDSQLSDDIFEISKILEREIKYIENLNYLGLSNEVATKLVFSPIILKMKEIQTDPRFDYRDTIEGGEVILWLNDFEKDKLYSKFYPSISRILDPHYPGQFHQIRKNIHSIVVPVDLSSEEEIFLVTRNLKSFISRGLAVRFGIVPLVETEEQKDAAAYFNHIARQNIDYALEYFDNILTGGPKPPSLAARKKNNEKDLEYVRKAAAWAKRLDVSSEDPLAFGNGFAISREEPSWIQALAYKLDGDIKLIQTLFKAKAVDDSTDIQDLLLKVASSRRSTLIFPDDPASAELLDFVTLYKSFGKDLANLPSMTYKVKEQTDKNRNMDLTLFLAADFDSAAGIQIFKGALKFITTNPLFSFKLKFLHNPGLEKNTPTLSTLIYYLSATGILSQIDPQELVNSIPDEPTEDFAKLPHIDGLLQHQSEVKLEGWSIPDNVDAFNYWNSLVPIVKALGLAPGDGLVALNSRVRHFSDFFYMIKLMKSLSGYSFNTY